MQDWYFLLYIVNELDIVNFIVYVDDTLEIGDKPALMGAIEYTKKEYATWLMGETEEFIGYTINCDLTKTTLNISQPDLINKTTQGFNEDAKLIMDLNTPTKKHKGIVRNQ